MSVNHGDSPKCMRCIEEAKTGQTYKVAGKQMYKCGSCGRVSERSEYKDEDFTWRTDSAWLTKAQNLMNAKKSKVGQTRVLEIKEQVAGIRK